MFNKVSNIDLCNKLSHLDNKMQIILEKINEETVKGCCDCKHNEKVLYEKMKSYIKEQFSTLEKSLLADIDTSVCVLKTAFNDMISDLEYIVGNLCKDSLTPSQYKEQINKYMFELNELETQVKEKCAEVGEEILKCENVIKKTNEYDLITLSKKTE